MNDLQKYLPIAAKVAEVVDYMMVEEMGLMPPEQYDVNERDDRIYITASFNPLALGRSLKAYENPDVARRLQSAMGGLPVTITRRSGTHYVVLLTGKVSLPRKVEFPGFGERDVFRMGLGLHGEISIPASRLQNVIIGAGQGAGKSNIQTLLVHQARAFGWKLYLADPDGHTFNPDIWNGIAAAPMASSPADLLSVLDHVASEVADRVALFRQAANGGIPPADVEAYNQVMMNEPLPRIALAIDEANSYLGDKRIFGQVADLLRRGRKWGLHIFLSGHEWHKETVPAEVNDMLQTRIALTVASEQTSAVVLRSVSWGKRVMGKPAGRGVMRTTRYEPMQFYLVTEDMEREWLGKIVTPAPLPENEAEMVRRAVVENDGKMTMGTLMGWGMKQWDARSLLERYEACGWLEKDASRGNARVVTAKLALLVSNLQTAQTASNPQIWRQTVDKPSQTQNLAGA